MKTSCPRTPSAALFRPPVGLILAMAVAWLACQGSSGSPFGFGNEATGGTSPARNGDAGGSGGAGGLGAGLGGFPGGFDPIAPGPADGGASAADGAPAIAQPGSARFKFCHILPGAEMPVPFELTIGSTTLEVGNGTCAPSVGAECPTIAAGSHTLALSNQGNPLITAEFTFVGGKEYVFVPAFDSASRGFKFLHAVIGEIKDQGTCAGLEWSDLEPYLDPKPDGGPVMPDAAAPAPDAPFAMPDASPHDADRSAEDAGPPTDAPPPADTGAPPSGNVMTPPSGR